MSNPNANQNPEHNGNGYVTDEQIEAEEDPFPKRNFKNVSTGGERGKNNKSRNKANNFLPPGKKLNESGEIYDEEVEEDAANEAARGRAQEVIEEGKEEELEEEEEEEDETDEAQANVGTTNGAAGEGTGNVTEDDAQEEEEEETGADNPRSNITELLMHILSSSNSMKLVVELSPLLANLSGQVAAANDQEQNMELEEFNDNIIGLMSLLGSVRLAAESESTFESEDEDDEEPPAKLREAVNKFIKLTSNENDKVLKFFREVIKILEEEKSGNNDGPIYVGGNFNPIHVILMLFNEVIHGRITFEELDRLLASFWKLIDCSGTVLRLAIDQAKESAVANEVTKYPLPLVCTRSLSTVQDEVQEQDKADDIDQIESTSDLLQALTKAAGCEEWYKKLEIDQQAWKASIDFLTSMTIIVRLYRRTTIKEFLQGYESVGTEKKRGGMPNSDKKKVARAIDHFRNKNEGLADDNHTVANLVESCIISSFMKSTSSAEDKQNADTLLVQIRKFFSSPSLNDAKYSLVENAPLTSTSDEILVDDETIPPSSGFYTVPEYQTRSDRRTTASRIPTDAIFAAKLAWSGTLYEQHAGIYSLLLTKLSKSSFRGANHNFMLYGSEDVHEKMKNIAEKARKNAEKIQDYYLYVNINDKTQMEALQNLVKEEVFRRVQNIDDDDV